MKQINLFITLVFGFLLFFQPVKSQTIFKGKILSANGTPIPKAAISVQPEFQRDIFGDQYEDVIASEDGSYDFVINKPGLYRIYFKGVFHNRFSIPVMVYDQPAMKMNILLMPKVFNDGLYFSEDDYMEWIRIYGNFNNYDYRTGKKFSLNEDGSISAFIPVNSDTIRYQIRGLTYSGGTSVLPQADKFELREDGSFQAVLYKSLPKDSLEIHYKPGKTIPFKRNLSDESNGYNSGLRGLISLENRADENWIRPLSLLQPYWKQFLFVDWEMAGGLEISKQLEIQQEFLKDDLLNFDFTEDLEKIYDELMKEYLHPQQKALLTLSYASILGWMSRKSIFHHMRSEETQFNKEFPEIQYDTGIIESFTGIVHPFHPAWKFRNSAVDFLLTRSENAEIFMDYFREAVRVHPDERAVRFIALAMIRHLGADYSSVEDMPVYRIIVERYGKHDLAREAHMAFHSQRTSGEN